MHFSSRSGLAAVGRCHGHRYTNVLARDDLTSAGASWLGYRFWLNVVNLILWAGSFIGAVAPSPAWAVPIVSSGFGILVEHYWGSQQIDLASPWTGENGGVKRCQWHHSGFKYLEPSQGHPGWLQPRLELCFKAFHLFLGAGCSWKILWWLGLWYHERKIRERLIRYIMVHLLNIAMISIYMCNPLCYGDDPIMMLGVASTQATPACSAHGPQAMLVPPWQMNKTCWYVAS